jgi:hypothetical protein
MTKKRKSEKKPPATTDTPPAEETGKSGVISTLASAKDFIAETVAHPEETARSLKEWTQDAAAAVDRKLEQAQETLAAVRDGIQQAREWSAEKAGQVDRTLEQAQGVVDQLDESVEQVQAVTQRAANGLDGPPARAAGFAEPVTIAPLEPEADVLDLPEDDTDFEVVPDSPPPPRRHK